MTTIQLDGMKYIVTPYLRWERRDGKLFLQQLVVRHYDDLVYRQNVPSKWIDVPVVDETSDERSDG